MVKKSLSSEDLEGSTQHSSSCKYTGVRKRKWGKWVSEIRLPNSRERIWLGSYDSPVKAARAFDAAQFCLRGSSANFNFPDNPPDIDGGRSMTPAEIQAAAARFANTIDAPVQMNGKDKQQKTDVSEHRTVEDSISYSPSISDGTVQIDSGEVTGVEESFQEQLSLNATLGSGNYVSDFGYYTGFEVYTGHEFYPTLHDNFEYSVEETYDDLWDFCS